MTKHLKPVKNSIFAARGQAPPTCQPSQMTNRGPLDEQFLVRLTISTLDLLEIIIIITYLLTYLHSIHPRNECRCYLIRCITAATVLLVRWKT